MPSTAPSYYHWSQDKPCTTNQVYGYYLKEYVEARSREPTKPIGPFDHRRPFSNAGFFPHISDGEGTGSGACSRSMTSQRRPPCVIRHGPHYCTPGPRNKFNINKGYVVGHVPITEKMSRGSRVPAGVMLSRSVSAPPAHQQVTPPTKDTYLWHTLSGTLVHVKNKRESGGQLITA